MIVKPNILVVEDDKNYIEQYRASLKCIDVEFQGVQTVHSAIDNIKVKTYSTIVVDLEILGIKGNVFGGFEILEYTRKVNPYTELLVITGHNENEIISRVSKLNVPFLIKPIEHRELSIAAEALIRDWCKHFDSINIFFERFHDNSTILSKRKHKSPVFLLSNEYDVQDLMHTMLKPFFHDIISEEYTLKRAGKTKRLDLVIKGLDTVIETKMIRDEGHATHIADELDIDIRGYISHPHCHRLFCYIYDPKHLIEDPRRVEQDLSGEASQDGRTIDVNVLIRP